AHRLLSRGGGRDVGATLSPSGRRCARHHPVIAHGDTLGPEASGLLILLPRGEPSRGVDHPPPAVRPAGGGEEPAHRTGRPRVPRLGGDLAVGDHVAGSQATQHGIHRSVEATGAEPVVALGLAVVLQVHGTGLPVPRPAYAATPWLPILSP